MSKQSLLLVLVLLTATSTVDAKPISSHLRSAAPEPVHSVTQLAAKAASAFRAGDFERSLTEYRAADDIATLSEDHAALRMNIAACLIELGHLEEAKSRLLSVAQLDSTFKQKSQLNAALVAIELNQLDEADALLEAVSPVEESLSARKQDIAQRIAERRKATTRTQFIEGVNHAARAIREEKWRDAEASLLALRRHFDVASQSERVDVLAALASTQLSLNRPREAKETLSAALALAPNDPELFYSLGRASQALGEDATARAHYRRAIALGLDQQQSGYAQARIAHLDPLGDSEWFGLLSVGGGFDSNPRQSGVATETTLGRRGQGGTAYGRAAIELGRTQRIHDKVSLRLRYAGDWLGLTKTSVQDLSLQTHGSYFGAQWAPFEKFVANVEAGPTVTYLGLDSLSFFSWDFVAITKLRYHVSKQRTWRMGFDFRKITGATSWRFLGGTRLDADLAHQWRIHPLDVRIGLRGRHLAIGARTTLVDATVMPACLNTCDGAPYFIPLSYNGLGPVLSARLTLNRALHLSGTSQMDFRIYRDQSYIAGVPASVKRRVDQRYTLGLDLEWALDIDEHFLIVPSYALLISASNVAQSSSQSAHLYDYDDRRFTQHFIELGFEANF